MGDVYFSDSAPLGRFTNIMRFINKDLIDRFELDFGLAQFSDYML